MGVTYSCMSSVLWGSHCIGESTERQQNALKAKQKVVRMLFAVVVLFTVCWLPYHIYFVYVSYNPHVTYLDHIQHVYLAMYWLAMSHTMYNPIVYYWMNKRFRMYFRKVLCCCLRQHDDMKALSANGRVPLYQASWTDRQHTLRVSMCSHPITAAHRDRPSALNGLCHHDTTIV